MTTLALFGGTGGLERQSDSMVAVSGTTSANCADEFLPVARLTTRELAAAAAAAAALQDRLAST